MHMYRKVGLGSLPIGLGIVALAACGSKGSAANVDPPRATDPSDASAPSRQEDDGGGDLHLFSGDSGASGSCSGLQCQQQACTGAATTSLSGTVYAPNGTLPIYNALVYVPNAPLEGIDAGLSCDQCGTPASGDPIVDTLTNSVGHFTLTNVPVGTNVPLVVQLGKWRRQTTISTVTACVDNPITDPNLTRLPKNQMEGNLPHIALATGYWDQVGCMLAQIGIDNAEFGVQADGLSKAVHVYTGYGADRLGGGHGDNFMNTPAATTLWTDAELINTYDAWILSSDQPDESLKPGSAPLKGVTDYMNAGGRVFTTAFGLPWFTGSPDPNIGVVNASNLDVTGIGTFEDEPNGMFTRLNETFPKGLALAQWLTSLFPANPLVEADGGPEAADAAGQLDFSSSTRDFVVNARAQSWAHPVPSSNATHAFTVNLPAGKPPAQQCGKGVNIQTLITGGTNLTYANFVGCRTSGKVGDNECFPSTCAAHPDENEAMLEFFFFDLSSCVQNDAVAPAPPVVR